MSSGLFLIQHQRMKLSQLFCRKFDHTSIIRHQAVDFCFDISRLRVNAGSDAFGFQVGKFFARDLIAVFEFIKSFRQIAVASDRVSFRRKMPFGRETVTTKFADNRKRPGNPCGPAAFHRQAVDWPMTFRVHETRAR